MSTNDRLKSLEQRVTALEQRAADPETPPPADEQPFWALEGLRARVEDPGAVMLVGSVQTPQGMEARWQVGLGTEELFASEFAERAEALSALAHPVRLQMLQRLLSDAETVQDLMGTEEFGTSGQVYHHLKQLVSAGWLRSLKRGRYQVPVERIVPLLGILMGAEG